MLAGLLALILALLLPAELFASPAVPVTGFTPGRVYAAGLNKSGQLGDGTHADRKHLVFSNAAAILSVAAGGEHSLALDADGHLRSWGRNLYGQLGDGTIGPAKRPALVLGLSRIVAIAAGGWYNLALRADGTVWAWGDNSTGELGIGTLVQQNTPVQVQDAGGPLTGITAIAAGAVHSLAVHVDGTVRAWGHNNHGQIGDGTLSDRLLPVAVETAIGASPLLRGIIGIAAGGTHSLALGADGTVWSWGWNGNGQLGDGTTVDRTQAVRVLAGPRVFLSDMIAIAGGASHSLVIRADGRALAWGSNGEGQLADGTTKERHEPVLMLNADGAQRSVTAIAAGGTGFSGSHSLLVIASAEAMAWGNNDHGQLGDGSNMPSSFPVPIKNSIGGDRLREKALAAGNRHSLALRSGGVNPPPGGTVYAWGANQEGQLGTSLPGDQNAPKQAETVERAAALAGGGAHSLALLADGTVWAWGSNSRGQLGAGSNNDVGAPEFVHDPAAPGSPFQGVIAIAAGFEFSLALRVDGTVWSWGTNDGGQLGDGTTDLHRLPVQVRNPGGDGFLTGVKAIAAGAYHSLALKADGTVWAWGGNTRGQVGDGTHDNRSYPILVTGLPTDRDAPWAIAIAAGGKHSLLLLANGHLRAWGANDRGQLGDQTNVDRPLPVAVHGPLGNSGDLDGTKAVTGGGEHTLALHALNGSMLAWGSNTDGQLGNFTVGSDSARPVYVLISDISLVTLQRVGAIAAGAVHSLALKHVQ